MYSIQLGTLSLSLSISFLHVSMFVFLLSLLCAVQSQKIPHFVFSHIELVFFFLSYCTFYNIPF